MATLNATVENPNKPKVSAPFATGAAVGVGAGAAQPAQVAPRAGATVGVGGGVAQGSAPSGGGGGGAAPAAPGPDYSALSQLAGAGLSAADIVALANRGSSAVAANNTPVAPGTPAGWVPNTDSSTTRVTEFAPEPASGTAALTDPNLLALLASFDNQLANTESGFRRQQGDAQQGLADAIPELGRQFDLNREGVKDSFEGRGLLKSGETEEAVGRTYEDQGRRQAQLEKNTADVVANLEQQIAQARIANAIARNNAMSAGAGQQVGSTVGSVS